MVEMTCAALSGCRYAGINVPVPISSRDVAAAVAVSTLNGSSRVIASESVTQAEWYPRSSALRAKSISCPVELQPAPTIASRVGMKTPTCARWLMSCSFRRTRYRGNSLGGIARVRRMMW